jgi:hypothetical protein
LDTTSQQAVWPELIKMEADANFIDELSRTYYEYQHMNRRLDLQLNYAPLAWKGSVGCIREVLISEIGRDASFLLADSKERFREIEEKLNLLL